MKYFLSLFIFLLISFSNIYAQVEVPKGKYPFYKMVEWPHHGTLLLSKDLSGAKNDIEVNLLNHDGEAIWDKIIYPSVDDAKLIVSDETDYVYLIENFSPKKNFIHYHQINQSGNIVSTKFDVLKVIRTYGYTIPSEMELTEVVNTPESIVFYFQLPIKSEDIIENIFVSITHHNNRVYHYKAPATEMKMKKKEMVDPILYAGSNLSSIYFSYYSTDGNSQSANFIGFTPKGDELIASSFKMNNVQPIFSEFNTLNLDGSTYVEDEDRYTARGKGVFNHGKFYFMVNDAKTSCLKIYGENEKGKIDVLNSCSGNPNEDRNPDASVFYFELDGDLFVTNKIDDNSGAYQIKESKVITRDFSINSLDNVQFNPSSFKTNNKTSNFVHLINGVPVSTSTENISKQEKIIFK
ncbi:hypothetical protein [Brumimicrobium aurantiacum]|uniref:Uncharacterized protein n=1 Tax=Brumimicrobium aurantiacum TaxID=1737063 RepID=A0A3E1F1Z0_9FLAO|nr:hypothetical protein [Brumimicrobium aurantiacum]RFC55838.1 hypothetical protein DXU93_02560 [Brumimicrobium aurantiacum]